MAKKSEILRRVRVLAVTSGDKKLAETVTQDLVDHIYECSLAELRNQLKATGEAALPGIGKLRLVFRKARTGRNPVTGDPVPIPPRITVGFTPSGVILKDLAGD